MKCCLEIMYKERLSIHEISCVYTCSFAIARRTFELGAPTTKDEHKNMPFTGHGSAKAWFHIFTNETVDNGAKRYEILRVKFYPNIVKNDKYFIYLKDNQFPKVERKRPTRKPKPKRQYQGKELFNVIIETAEKQFTKAGDE